MPPPEPEVEHRLAFAEIDERSGVAASQRRRRPPLGKARRLLLPVKVAGDRVVGRAARGTATCRLRPISRAVAISPYFFWTACRMSVAFHMSSIYVAHANICRRQYCPYAYICQEEYTWRHERCELATLGEAFKAFADPTRLADSRPARRRGNLRVQHSRVPRHSAAHRLAPSRVPAAEKSRDTRKDGLWVHYRLAPLDEPVMRVLMSAVTHVLCHCDAIVQEIAQRLETQTGCCVPSDIGASRVLRAAATARRRTLGTESAIISICGAHHSLRPLSVGLTSNGRQAMKSVNLLGIAGLVLGFAALAFAQAPRSRAESRRQGAEFQAAGQRRQDLQPRRLRPARKPSSSPGSRPRLPRAAPSSASRLR